MKLASFNDYRLGAVRNDEVVDVTDVLDPQIPPLNRMTVLIAEFDAYRPRVEAALSSGVGVPVTSVRLRPPQPKPVNVVCMAVNYMEDGTRSEPAPINAFHKSPVSIIGDGDTIVLPDAPATIFEGEAELAVVIGREASRIRAEDAMAHVFGYMNFVDGSARGLPPAGNTFFQMKSRDTFAPLGPFIVTADEVADPHDLDVRLWVNGQIRQEFNTSDMAHRIGRCLEWVSSIHTLVPGDIVATGTNHRGLGPLQDGDRVELEISGLGRLTLGVEDPLKRRWARETRLERQERGLEGTTPELTG